MASSSSRTRSRSPFSHRRPPSPYSSASSTSSSHINNRLLPRSSSTPTSTVYNSGGVSGSRSMSITRTISDSGPIGGSGTYVAQSPLPYPSEGLIDEPVQTITSERDSISVTVRFRPMRYGRSGSGIADLFDMIITRLFWSTSLGLMECTLILGQFSKSSLLFV